MPQLAQFAESRVTQAPLQQSWSGAHGMHVSPHVFALLSTHAPLQQT
jgi:hypothetical protein